MLKTRLLCRLVLAMMATLVPYAVAQVQTEVPPAISGAKPVAVERINVHGASLEGNLEGEAVDRDVLVFLPRVTPKKNTADIR